MGAFLTQNTSWTNVERAVTALRKAGLLSLHGIRNASPATLEELIRSSGYFRQKAARLKAFVDWLDRNYSGSLEQLFQQPAPELRQQLLSLKGVGPETADTILLYAANHEIFVVDAYARRILERHQVVASSATYDDIRDLAERALATLPDASHSCTMAVSVKLPMTHVPSIVSSYPRSGRAQYFNEAHALLVQVGKHYCHRTKPLCQECPLAFDLPASATILK